MPNQIPLNTWTLPLNTDADLAEPKDGSQYTLLVLLDQLDRVKLNTNVLNLESLFRFNSRQQGTHMDTNYYNAHAKRNISSQFASSITVKDREFFNPRRSMAVVLLLNNRCTFVMV
jgi:hypothetical protein